MIVRFSSVVLVVVLVFALSVTSVVAEEDGLDSGSKAGMTENKEVVATGIELGEYKSHINIGETVDLEVTVLPVDATNQTVSYKSSNVDVATVSAKGQIKGVSRGETTIELTAEKITKSITITVTGAKTVSINLNRESLVLKPSETFQIAVAVSPVDAVQEISFRALDPSVAEVYSDGTVKGLRTGNTSIIVSNGEMTAAVSVIVNQTSATSGRSVATPQVASADAPKPALSEAEINIINQIEQGDGIIYVSQTDCPVITSPVLKVLGLARSTLLVEAEEYLVSIAGTDISNYENELNTQISFKKEGEGVSFLLNEGENLPGKVTLTPPKMSQERKYLYIWNEAKDQYEKLNAKPSELLTLDEPAKYLLTDENLDKFGVKLLWVIGALCIVFLGIAIYIVIRRRYLFW